MQRKRDGQRFFGRWLLGASIAIVATASLPAMASAATVTGDADSIDFGPDAGESNAVTITNPIAVSYTVTDPANALDGQGTCADDGSPDAGEPVTCLVPALADVIVPLGDMNDSANTSALGGGVASDLNGEDGNDTLTSGAGADRLIGGLGDDGIDGGGGEDLVDYSGVPENGSGIPGWSLFVNLDFTEGANAFGDGSDTVANVENLFGSPFDDFIGGDGSQNMLIGSTGDDSIQGLGADDQLLGGDDSDTATFITTSGDVTANLTTGEATGTGTGTDALTDFENIAGSGGNDTLTGDAGNNSLAGLGGTDTVTFNVATMSDLSDASPSHNTTSAEGNDLVSAENLVGSSGVDVLDGDGNANAFDGNGGEDILRGVGGADDLDGGADNDELQGGTGNDIADGGAGSDQVDGGDDNDRLDGGADNDDPDDDPGAGVYGGPGDDTLLGSGGNDQLVGDLGIDTISFQNAPGPGPTGVTADMATSSGAGSGTDTYNDAENLLGSSFDDTLTGDPNSNGLTGLAGDDALSGDGDDDALEGGSGDDIYDGDDGADRAIFTGATGGVNISLQTPGSASGQGIDAINDVENATGSGFNDTIMPSEAENSIDGAGGDDLIHGANLDSTPHGGGNDTFSAGPGADQLSYSLSNLGFTINTATSQVTGDGTTDTFSDFESFVGSVGPDTFNGGPAADVFDGGSGADTINGGGAVDTLNGGSQNDTLSGNGGVDALEGDGGTDTASYEAASDAVTASLNAGAATDDGDGSNDTISEVETLTGSNNGDDLTGVTGSADTINALGGADLVRSRDSSADNIDCGIATDRAITDTTEGTVTACETRDTPAKPTTPSITGSTPASGANDNAPRIRGNALAGATVRLYKTSNCSGTPVATGSAASFTSPGLAVSVPDNSTTALRASVTHPLDSDGASVCSAAFSYREVTPGPDPEPDPDPDPDPEPDVTAPETTIAKLIKKTKDTTPTYEFSSSEQGSTFECAVDKGDFKSCASPHTLKKLKKGKHTFSIRAIDAAGNADQTPAVDKFEVKKKKKRGKRARDAASLGAAAASNSGPTPARRSMTAPDGVSSPRSP